MRFQVAPAKTKIVDFTKYSGSPDRILTRSLPARFAFLVEGVQAFLGVVRGDDVADRLDCILDGPAVLEVVGAEKGVARQLHDDRRLPGEIARHSQYL